MESNKRVLNQMRHYPDDWFLGSQTVLSGMQNAIHGIDVLISSSARLKNNLLSVRHTLLHTMEIRNANYMRANTIALRRIAAQAQVESKHAKAQSESSAKNAVTATRIAILTMIYLPPTFVATVFSTPFLQLDDELQFSAAKKIWVYIVASLACILITLLSFLPWLTDRNSKPKETSPVEDDTGLQNPDEALLEPMAVALPDVKDLEREVKKRMFPGRFALDAEDAEVDAFEWPDKHFLPPEEDSTE
ncbi:hypothetical protein TrVGV298_008710 [Trichoderma virens]|nr:hypothetical protein TrVGV298_008710 [Trichoderma virens]